MDMTLMMMMMICYGSDCANNVDDNKCVGGDVNVNADDGNNYCDEC